MKKSYCSICGEKLKEDTNCTNVVKIVTQAPETNAILVTLLFWSSKSSRWLWIKNFKMWPHVMMQ